jgi:hypothetical protein
MTETPNKSVRMERSIFFISDSVKKVNYLENKTDLPYHRRANARFAVKTMTLCTIHKNLWCWGYHPRMTNRGGITHHDPRAGAAPAPRVSAWHLPLPDL